MLQQVSEAWFGGNLCAEIGLWVLLVFSAGLKTGIFCFEMLDFLMGLQIEWHFTQTVGKDSVQVLSKHTCYNYAPF